MLIAITYKTRVGNIYTEHKETLIEAEELCDTIENIGWEIVKVVIV